MTAIRQIDPATLKAWLHDGAELAILDAREEESFSTAHLLYAANLPLSRLERLAPRLLPRRSLRLVLTDAGEGLAIRAARRLAGFGYTEVAVLAGGNAAWAAAGFPLYSGVHVPSKAFAEVIEHDLETPWITAQDLAARRAAGERLVLIDARPVEEHRNHTVPGSICVPGAELPLRVTDLIASRQDLVVVHCGGRTRSIIGAQALISAGLPNPVVSLKDGTMAWAQAGYALAEGSLRLPPAVVSPAARGFGGLAGRRVAEAAGVRSIDRAGLDAWRAEAGQRSLLVFDVRTPAEYREGHLPGAISAPGGQLVQETDSYIAVLGARVVLVDDGGLARARITAFWLEQLGVAEVAVFDGGLGEGPLETGDPAPLVLGLGAIEDDDIPRVPPAALADLLAYDPGVQVIDLALSKRRKQGHIPGSRFAVRARLADRLEHLPEGTTTLVLTSEDGTWARLAAAELRALGLAGLPGRPGLALAAGGNEAWIAAGLAVQRGIGETLDTVDDVWFAPRERAGDTARHMSDYLDWEVKLLTAIQADEDSRLSPLRATITA